MSTWTVSGRKPTIDRLREWYRGRYVPPPRDDPHSSMVFLGPGYYEQPPLAKLLGALGRFWLKHWQWIIAVIVAPLLFAIIFG